MDSPLVGENLFLVYSLAMGIFITFVYDLLRIFRRVIPHRNFFVSVEDLFFWCFCAVSVFLMMHRENNGTLRWFAVLGALAGMLVYKKTISSIFVKWTSAGMNRVKKLLGRILGIIGKPFAFAGRKTKKAAKYGGSRGKQFLRFLKKRLTAFLKMLKIALCKQ